MGPVFLDLLAYALLPNLVSVLMVAQRKKIRCWISEAKGHIQENHRGNRFVNNKQIPPNPDLRKETSALFQNYLAFALRWLWHYISQRKKKKTYHTVNPVCDRMNHLAAFIPFLAIWSGESTTGTICSLCPMVKLQSLGLCMNMWDRIRIWAYLNVNTDLIQVPLLNSTLMRLYYLRVHKDNQK